MKLSSVFTEIIRQRNRVGADVRREDRVQRGVEKRLEVNVRIDFANVSAEAGLSLPYIHSQDQPIRLCGVDDLG